MINNCPGCDLIFSKKYDGVATKSVWEELADSDFPFPDYGGMRMAVHDSCDVRGKDEVYDAVRKILTRMNIVVVDPIKCRAGSVCCGASMYDKMTEAQWLAFVEKRAKDFPIDDVAVYCVSCLKYIGKVGKKPHHLIDLLFK
ncbi:MAG: hypothetical protein LBV09_08500 [Deferribacteraceae bacterium]|nr:hypothetical protein [Deferribacteraceae bacterium]